MEVLRRLFYFFTPYTDANERAVGHFFKRLSEHKNQSRTRAKLLRLVQEDIAAINLWSEYRYKGYKYLRKSQRRKLYANLQHIAEDFDDFYTRSSRTPPTAADRIKRLAPQAVIEPKRAVLIHALMDYFSTQRGIYQYRDSSSFGRLLRDPTHEKLVGDCNQIVTLYIYLYSCYFDVSDLKLRVTPGHVALHYGGIDIETTRGAFARYNKEKGNALLPIEEIVSINLLDATDSYLSTHEVSPKDILQSSRMAYILSHDRSIVTNNLHSAYGRLINSLVERHDYSTARRYAKDAPQRKEMVKNIWQSEAVYWYKSHHYHEAAKAFKHSGDHDMVRHCYEALFFVEQKKLGHNLTSEIVGQYAGVIKHMRGYAKKSGNKKLIKHADQLYKYL